MNTRHFNQFPKAYLAYPKVIQGLIFKKPKMQPVLPQVTYQVDAFNIDQKHLNAYNLVCDFKDDAYIPAIYLAVLSQSLQMQMMTQEAFPFAILGLVHIRNQITQFRPIGRDEQLCLSCAFGELQAHEKGMQFDFLTTVKVGGEVVMQGIMTYLSRQKMRSLVEAKNPIKVDQTTPLPEYQRQAIWAVSENIGRRYAKVSGDYNLIHLHALTAKAFGFKQAIAHGMWSNARALASIDLTAAYRADVWFKLPLYLPSQVEFLTAERPEEMNFLIQNQKNKKPHVVGSVKAI